MTADESAVERIINDYDIITDLISTITNPTSQSADEACKILNNLTRTEKGSLEFLKKCKLSDSTDVDDLCYEKSKLKSLIDAFCKVDFNQHKASLDHIASVFANITQTAQGRKLLLDHDSAVIGQLIPFLKVESSPLIRRKGVSMTLKNCCFESEQHQWLLEEDFDFLSELLLPIAGPEELDDEENDSLPLDLQYLPDDKIREPDPEIRKTLLEALSLLCVDKFGRTFLKKCGTYYIIRELHLWEIEQGQEENGHQCEKLVQILIADEPEPGMENLMKIPADKMDEFEKKMEEQKDSEAKIIELS